MSVGLLKITLFPIRISVFFLFLYVDNFQN